MAAADDLQTNRHAGARKAGRDRSGGIAGYVERVCERGPTRPRQDVGITAHACRRFEFCIEGQDGNRRHQQNIEALEKAMNICGVACARLRSAQIILKVEFTGLLDEIGKAGSKTVCGSVRLLAVGNASARHPQDLEDLDRVSPIRRYGFDQDVEGFFYSFDCIADDAVHFVIDIDAEQCRCVSNAKRGYLDLGRAVTQPIIGKCVMITRIRALQDVEQQCGVGGSQSHWTGMRQHLRGTPRIGGNTGQTSLQCKVSAEGRGYAYRATPVGPQGHRHHAGSQSRCRAA